MQFLCDCGERIADQSDSLPHKAHLLPDEALFECFGGVVEKLDAYAAALLAGEGDKWVRENFNEGYAGLNLSREQMIGDLLYRTFFEHSRHAFVCKSCGRLYVADPRREGWVVFCPGDEPPRMDVLRRNVEGTREKGGG